MATHQQSRRSIERLTRLVGSRQDGVSIQEQAIAELKRVVGFERWCLPQADPDTLLPVAAMADHDYVPGIPRLLELEYSVDAYATKPALAKSTLPAASLQNETRGDLARSSRWDQVMRPVGIGDVAAVACRDEFGCWGWIEAYRDRDDAPFNQIELDLLAQAGGILATVLRRKGAYATGGFVDARQPGVVIFDSELSMVSWSPWAPDWLDSLPPASLFKRFGVLPAILFPTAVLARSGDAPCHARVHAEDGRWVMVEASPMLGAGEGHVVVTLRSPTQSETFDLLARVHGLSPRERELVQLLSLGLNTGEVGKRLFISPLTVQDHLKNVFDKVGVRSRRELVARFSLAAH